MISAFPKIFAIGDRHILNIFKGEVEITEKIDGSQFIFGRVERELYCRSKGKMLILDAPEKMFTLAVEHVLSVQDNLPDNAVYYSEYLKKPKHNSLAYDNVPKNHITLFGAVRNDKWASHEELSEVAKCIDVDVVPLIYRGEIKKPDEIFELIERESYLGGQNIEGIVVKNYNQPFFISDRVFPVMAGKYVSEKFKEKHQNTWKKENTGKGKWQVFCENFRTEARWEKAVQHLKESGNLEGSPRDIGGLIKEIQRDITEEEKDNIMEFLWRQFGGELLRGAIRGCPEWYKEELARGSFK